MPAQFEKNVPNVFPLTAARSMYEPFNRLKFGQFASYYDQMRAGVKYFVEKKGKKNVCAMYQDTDFGRDVLAGAVEQIAAMGMKLVGETAHKPTDTDFNASVAKLRDANCDLIVHRHHRQGHHADHLDRAQAGLERRICVGQFAIL